MATPIPITFTDPSVALEAGQQYVPSAAGRDISPIVANGYTRATMLVDVRNYTSSDEIVTEIEYSIDGWATVIYGGGGTSRGGSHVNKDGSQGIYMSADLPYIPPGSTLRQRFKVTVPSANTIGPVTLTLS